MTLEFDSNKKGIIFAKGSVDLSKNILNLTKKVQFCGTKKYFMNKHLKILIFLLIFVLSPIIVQNTLAQTPPPAENVVPIDGGLGFLLAAGIAYAAKKIYNNRDQEI